MASLQTSADAVKAAVSSTTTCTPATAVALRELLSVDAEPPTATARSASRVVKSSVKSNSKTGAASKRPPTRPELLSPKDRTVLATHVVNATLKALTEAAKPLPPSTPSKATESLAQSAAKRTLRRSNSAPLSPMHPRGLNRVASSPNAAHNNQKSTLQAHSTGCLAVAECARAAFVCLRSLKTPQEPQYDFQIENGMSVFIGKLLVLKLNDQALKEMRLLKGRLLRAARVEAPKNSTSASVEKSTVATEIADLLHFEGNISQLMLPIITSLHNQVLQLVCATKKPAQVEAVLLIMRATSPSSPLALMTRLAECGDKQARKACRQLAAVSQNLLSMLPSISAHEDAFATEPRLSPSPLVAFELQAISFRTQVQWWALAGHKGSADEDLLSLFNRCTRALIRRHRSDDKLMYRDIAAAYESLTHAIRSHGYELSSSSSSPLSSSYQMLGITAYAARQYDDACRWFESLKALLCPQSDPAVVMCSVSARILACRLKKPQLGDDVEPLIQEVTESLGGSLSGTVIELNELLESLSAVRRSAAGLLMKEMDTNGASKPLSQTTSHLLKEFILQYPRFMLRWMGTTPGNDATGKQMLQFEQRRRLIMQSINQSLDATLTVMKCNIQSGTIEWPHVDEVLQHCLRLLESVGDPSISTARAEHLGSYHVKISALYYSKHVELRQSSDRSKDANKHMLQSLSRSIDVVRECSAKDKDKAQLTTKLELFADLCRKAGRSQDAIGTLRSICTTMVEDGVLSDVAMALKTMAPALAWSATGKTSSLSRTLRSIAKLDKSWNDWTFFLPEPERAAVLEHLLHQSIETSAGQVLHLHDPSPAALLRIYTLDKYPVRRFRVLVHLLHQNLGQEDEVANIANSLAQAARQLQKTDVGEDSSLARFIPHLQAYYSCLTALFEEIDDSFPTTVIRNSISSWKTMVESSQSREDLYSRIDDPETIMSFLEALNSLAELRGEAQLQIVISDLSIALCKAMSRYSNSSFEGVLLNYSRLATQHVNIGNFAQATDVLSISQGLLQQHEGSISRGVAADFYLAQAQYYAGMGRLQESSNCVGKAELFLAESRSLRQPSRTQMNVALSTLALLQSMIALQSGSIEHALITIKSGIRTLSHDWARLEASTSPSSSSVSESSTTGADARTTEGRATGPRLWKTAAPLLRCLLQISNVYAHVGMFQETVFYAETACKLAESTQASLYRCQVATWIGSLYLKASKPSRALEALEAARDMMPRDSCSSRVQFARKLGEAYSELGDGDHADEYFSMAEETLALLGNAALVPQSENAAPIAATTRTVKAASARGAAKGATKGASKGAVTGAVTGAARGARATTRATTRATRAKAPPPTTSRMAKHTATARAKTVVECTGGPGPSLPKDIYQSSLLAAVILSRALGHIQKKEWSSAMSTLDRAKELPKLLETLSTEQIMMATALFGHSMEQIVSDPVFSVMQDSTISFPAISSCPDRRSIDRSLRDPSASPPKRGRGTSQRYAKDRMTPAFAEALRQAQDILMGAHASTLSSSDSATVHRLSTLLQNTIILLSATTASSNKAVQSSALATVAVDFGRNIAWTREQDILRGPPEIMSQDAPCLSEVGELSTSTPKPSGDLLPVSMSTFSKTYIDLLPKSWCVISLSLSDNRHDLYITKLQAGDSPFVLRLPLERANYRDADSQIFNFEHGRKELLDIIRLANETSHSARDFSAKGERSAWWAEREALDVRLRDLLSTVETTWLGGFKGIFSQHRRRPELLAGFRKSFQRVLDRCLPSRNRMRGSKTGRPQSVCLDARILDLFVALGDPIDADDDFDEAVNDLLYFVVDILQFHGERNAYDEIDFDAMVVETYDALRGYHSAAAKLDMEEEAEEKADKAEEEEEEEEGGSHTILVLDKALHAFPWESLPCMQGLAVSRVPSLACLGQLMRESKPPSRRVSRKAGTYMLNPSSDLKNTQTFFQPSFRTLDTWTAIVNKEPQEAEFEEALCKSDIFLYFGHGSGAQYIRGKTVRRLDKCKPVTFLMGCSSASLSEAGEFECFGPVWNYMLAGCPAVVGTLWDVTDRDIDRFAGRAFEEWGLFPRGTFRDESRSGRGRDKGKKVGDAASSSSSNSSNSSEQGGDDNDDNGAALSSSLPEAVARARDVCKFRYLNAAAVVMYGIPVYLRQE